MQAKIPGQGNPERYVDGVLELLDAFPARVLLPVSDASVEALRSRRTEVERSTALALADEKALLLATDKSRTLALAESLGLPVPRGVTVQDVSETREAAGQMGFPLVVKPAMSWATRSPRVGRLVCQVVLTQQELDDAVAHVVKGGSAALLQQWACGRREAVSLFVADGRVWARFAQVAHRMHPALGGNSVLRESILLPEDATRFAERLVLAMGLTGYSEVEFRRDALGRPLLMEVNPRLSASVEVAVRAGVDFPRLIYSWTLAKQLHTVDTYRLGVRMRWLGGEWRYLHQALHEQGRPDVPPFNKALGSFLADTLRPARYDYFRLGDPLPAISAAVGLARSAGHRILLDNPFATSS